METAIAAVAEVGRLMEDAGDEPFAANDGQTLLVDWVWGTEDARGRAIRAVSSVVRNRVLSLENFPGCDASNEDPYATCAQSTDFQARHDPSNQAWLSTHDFKSYELSNAKAALEGVEDPTNGAVYFIDTSESPPGGDYTLITNWHLLSQDIINQIGAEERGFYFYK